jgi:hypothetical protein
VLLLSPHQLCTNWCSVSGAGMSARKGLFPSAVGCVQCLACNCRGAAHSLIFAATTSPWWLYHSWRWWCSVAGAGLQQQGPAGCSRGLSMVGLGCGGVRVVQLHQQKHRLAARALMEAIK